MQVSVENNPLVSLCIPTFNRVGLLKECIESVKDQSFKNIEILVGNNFSTDGTADYLNGTSGLQVEHHQSNLGMVGNWNSLLRRARGQLCVLLSDDDIVAPDFVATLVQYMRDDQCAFAYSPVTIIDTAGSVLGETTASPLMEKSERFVKATLEQKRVPYPSALMFRTADAAAVGYFKDIGNQTDVAFRISLAEIHPGANISCHPKPLVRYRIHAAALTDNPELKASGRIKFQHWVSERYDASEVFCRMAIFDLINLRLKNFPVENSTFLFPGAEKSNFFVRRVNWIVQNKTSSLTLLIAVFPFLAVRHFVRLINNRRYHKRFLASST